MISIALLWGFEMYTKIKGSAATNVHSVWMQETRSSLINTRLRLITNMIKWLKMTALVCAHVYLSIQVCQEHTDIWDHCFRNQGTEFRQKAREGLHPWSLSSQLITGFLPNLPETQIIHDTCICLLSHTVCVHGHLHSQLMHVKFKCQYVL